MHLRGGQSGGDGANDEEFSEMISRTLSETSYVVVLYYAMTNMIVLYHTMPHILYYIMR